MFGVSRLLFLYEGKIVWQGMTHEFTSSQNPIVQQVMALTVKHRYLDLFSCSSSDTKLELST